jgi:hypothetical protein
VSDDTYLMLVDGEVQAVDLGPMLRRHRAEIVRHRAGLVDQAADLLMNESFDISESYDAAEAAGMPAGMINSAGNVAWELLQIEQRRR